MCFVSFILCLSVVVSAHRVPVVDSRFSRSSLVESTMPLQGASKKRFDELYDTALQCKSDTKIVSMMDEMVPILMDANEAYEMDVPPERMGVHPSNRGGKLVVHTKVHSKGSKVVNVGFSPKLCGPDKAMAFEDNPLKPTIADTTIELTSSDERFADFDHSSIVGGSVGCSHLNQFLACVNCEVPTAEASLCKHGEKRMSKAILTGKDKHLKHALEKGLKWTIVRFKIEEQYPRLPWIFQTALNVEHHIGEGACLSSS